VHRCTVPKRSRAKVCCRVNCRKISDLRVVEGALGGVYHANSLSRLDEWGEFLIQCVNPFTEPVEMPAGLLVRKFNSEQKEDVGAALETADKANRVPTRNSRGPLPEHVAELYEYACDGCESKWERLVVAQLLSEYKDVLSCGEHDVGLTTAVCNEGQIRSIRSRFNKLLLVPCNPVPPVSCSNHWRLNQCTPAALRDVFKKNTKAMGGSLYTNTTCL